MAIEREKLHAWVYEALVIPKARLGGGSQPLQLSDISRWVKQKAQQENLLSQDTHIASNNLRDEDENAIRECIWGLIIQGIVVPGVSNDDTYRSNLPWMQVTEWGKSCLKKGEYLPYDTGLFINRLRNQIAGLDQTVELYLTEALNSFRAGNYLATAVMMGVASERILIVLRDSIHAAIQEGIGRRSFRRIPKTG